MHLDQSLTSTRKQLGTDVRFLQPLLRLRYPRLVVCRHVFQYISLRPDHVVQKSSKFLQLSGLQTQLNSLASVPRAGVKNERFLQRVWDVSDLLREVPCCEQRKSRIVRGRTDVVH